MTVKVSIDVLEPQYINRYLYCHKSLIIPLGMLITFFPLTGSIAMLAIGSNTLPLYHIFLHKSTYKPFYLIHRAKFDILSNFSTLTAIVFSPYLFAYCVSNIDPWIHKNFKFFWILLDIWVIANLSFKLSIW